MPNISDRQALLTEVEEAMKFAIMDQVVRDDDWSSSEDDGPWLHLSDDEEDPALDSLATLHVMVTENRYLNSRGRIPKSKDFVENYFLDLPDDMFRKITRVTRPTFFHIVSVIESNRIFHNDSTCDQYPVHWQLAVALDRLGNDGQGVSHARSKFIWGIAQGTVHLYTRRVITALFALRNDYIGWPTGAERLVISKRMEIKGFKNCVGFVDGTTIPLHKKPAVCGNIFMDRKKRYSVNAQVACDDQCHITFFMTGHPGSVGDSRVFSGSVIAKRADLAFSEGEYLLTDSGYGATPFLVPAYKDNQRDCRGDRDEPRKIGIFNTLLAKARVVNEHCIGILKGWWSSLRGMRVDIHEECHIQNYIEQATACVVLHNLCMGDPWEEEYVDEEGANEGEGPMPQLGFPRLLTPGQRKRLQVRRACLAYHDIVI